MFLVWAKDFKANLVTFYKFKLVYKSSWTRIKIETQLKARFCNAIITSVIIT